MKDAYDAQAGDNRQVPEKTPKPIFKTPDILGRAV